MLLPRLRLMNVLGRGALFGALANLVPLAGMLAVTEHHDRETFLAVVSGLGLIGGGFLLLTGLFFWSVCGSDVRRWRDLRTITGQTGAVTIMAPACVRAGVVGLLLFPGPYGLYHLVDAAPFGSWLYGG